MAKITVYRFRVYDIQSDESQLSRRWGTLRGIRRVCGIEDTDTAVEVDEAEIGREVYGLTQRDFDPIANAWGRLRESPFQHGIVKEIGNFQLVSCPKFAYIYRTDNAAA